MEDALLRARPCLTIRRLLWLALLSVAFLGWGTGGRALADGVGPSNTGDPPSISGTAVVGGVLTADPGQWSGDLPMTYSYQWSDGQTTTTNTVTLTTPDLNRDMTVTVTASNDAGQASVTSDSVGPVVLPAPVASVAPWITGTAQQGDTLSVNPGMWSNSPNLSYEWEDCSDSTGTNCSAIAGATSPTYTLQASDVGNYVIASVTGSNQGGQVSVPTVATGLVLGAVASQPTTTNLLVTPSSPVTNQSVTLIATVTAGTSSTALWGDVTFESRGVAIGGCANMAVVPSGQSATVACSTSFAASSAQVSAVFTPAAGSTLKGSSGSAGLTVGPDSSSTALDASSSVEVGTSTTYTATVTPPAARPGPVEPTGWVEFLDGGEPIGPCASQPLINGEATCAVTYTIGGAHEISALYSGDANFSGSSSPTDQVNAAAPPASVQGTIASTMQWEFYYTPGYTIVRALVVNGVSQGATVIVKCHGHGCPFASHATLMPTGKNCGKKAGRMCFTAGSFYVTPGFGGRRLKIGARITVRIMQPNWIGKNYSFTVRARRGPSIQIGCLAPGSANSAVGC